MDVEVAEEEPGPHQALTPEARTGKNGSEECFIFHISSRNFIEIRLSTIK